MKYFNPLSLTFLCICMIGCESHDSENSNDTFTIEEAEAIVDRYDLDEGTFSFTKNANLANEGSGDRINIGSMEEFEVIVIEAKRYQNSKEGRLAKKLHEFGVRSVKENWSDEKIDTFYKNIDKEFDTNLFDIARKELPENAKSYTSSTFGLSKEEREKVNKANKAYLQKVNYLQ